MPSNFVKTLDTPEVQVTMNELQQDTSLSGLADILSASVESIGTSLQERKDAGLYGDFTTKLSSLDADSQATLDAIAAERSRVESVITSLSPDEVNLHREYMSRLESLRIREEQTGRNQASARNSLLREYINRAPHLTDEFITAGRGIFAYEKDAAAYVQSFDAQSNPYMKAREAIFMQAYSANMPVGWVREGHRVKAEADKLTQEFNIKKVFGEETSIVLRSLIDVSVRDANLYLQKKTKDYASGGMPRDQFLREVNSYLNTFESAARKLVDEATVERDEEGKPIGVTAILPENFYGYVQTQINGLRSIYGGMADSQSIASRWAETHALYEKEATETLMQLYPSMASWIMLAPAAAGAYVTTKIPEFDALLRKYPISYIKSGAEAGQPDALAALDRARQHGQARLGAAIGAMQANPNEVNARRINEMSRLLKELSDPTIDRLTPPSDPSDWPFWSDMLQNVKDDPDAPPPMTDTQRFISSIITMYRISNQKNGAPSDADPQWNVKGGVLPSVWKPHIAYFKKNPTERDLFVTQYQAETDKVVNDAFSFDLGGGMGKYARDVVFDSGAFWATRDPSGGLLSKKVRIINMEADMMRDLGYSEEDILQRQQYINSTIQQHGTEWDEFWATVRNTSLTGDYAGPLSAAWGMAKQLMGEKTPEYVPEPIVDLTHLLPPEGKTEESNGN